MNKPNEYENNANINLQSDIVDTLIVHKNVKQEIVMVSIDRLKLTLQEHHNIIKNKNAWTDALAIFIALLLADLASEFHDFLGVEASVWKAIFIISTVVALIYFIRCVYYALKSTSNIDDLIEKIKRHADKP